MTILSRDELRILVQKDLQRAADKMTDVGEVLRQSSERLGMFSDEKIDVKPPLFIVAPPEPNSITSRTARIAFSCNANVSVLARQGDGSATIASVVGREPLRKWGAPDNPHNFNIDGLTPGMTQFVELDLTDANGNTITVAVPPFDTLPAVTAPAAVGSSESSTRKLWLSRGWDQIYSKTPAMGDVDKTLEQYFKSGERTNGHPPALFYDGDDSDTPSHIVLDKLSGRPAVKGLIRYEQGNARKSRGFAVREEPFGTDGIPEPNVVFSMKILIPEAADGGIVLPSESGYGTYIGLGHYVASLPGMSANSAGGSYRKDAASVRICVKGSSTSNPGQLFGYTYGIEDYEQSLRGAAGGNGSSFTTPYQVNDMRGRWADIDIELRANTRPDLRNGTIALHIDGEEVHREHDVRLFGVEGMRWKGPGQFLDQRFALNPKGSAILYRDYAIYSKAG